MLFVEQNTALYLASIHRIHNSHRPRVEQSQKRVAYIHSHIFEEAVQ